MSDSSSKPSTEATTDAYNPASKCTEEDITVGKIQFATAPDVQDSIKLSAKKTELYTLTAHLESIDKMTPIPTLKQSNWNQWLRAIRDLISFTQTSAAFLEYPPQTKSVRLWSNWWAAKLRETAPQIHSAPSDSPRIILSHIVRNCRAKIHTNVVKIVARFWDYKPEKGCSIQSFIKEYEKRYQDLREHSNITTEVEFQIRYVLLDRISNIHPELSHRCRNFSFDEILSECLEWAPPSDHKSHAKKPHNTFKCNYCDIAGHKEEDCRKKKKAYKEQKGGIRKQILSLDKLEDKPVYQLDTAADFHVSGNKDDFSSYINSPQTVRVAGGGKVNITGSGDILLPAIDNKTDRLEGAIYMPGQRTRILSTAQLERQGYSICWPRNYRDVQLLRPNGSICANFSRVSGRLIWKPADNTNNSPQIYSIQRDWHTILGHPGLKAQEATLKMAGIKGYKAPINCETCSKTKITTSKGHGIIRSASTFADVIHMDLVGGQKALSPTTTEKSVPTATWFLLAVDEYTSYKWAWPVYTKKTVPTQIRYFLEHLKTKFNKTPVKIHTDCGTEFSNSHLQEELLSRGIEWHRSSSHAPEQNGIAERNVRTVIEKMRALHLQSGLPLRLWPVILTASINILNMTPNKISPHSPYFSVFQQKPKIQSLHSFGCRVFWLDPDQNKLNSKAKEGIYAGTEFTGGHIILNPETGRTIIRRDIRAHEKIFPLKTEQVLSVRINNRLIIDNALSGPKAEAWINAMDAEIDNMMRNNVWNLVPRAEAKGKLMTGIWSLKEKSDGKLKARWCARGFSEPHADDTYADVLPPTTMRMLLALAASKDLRINHVDITAAFLHADLDYPIYIEQPHKREKPGNLVCKLNKAIYGLRTAPRRWQQKLRKVLHDADFKSLKYDNNVFRRNNTIISTYVDDFMILAKTNEQINEAINMLSQAFQIKNLGEMTKFLGINIRQTSDGIRIDQMDKIEALCNDMGMDMCRGASTPVADDNLIDCDTDLPCTNDEANKYRSVVGSLLHIAKMTRPDIQYAVNRLSRRVHHPSNNAILALKHLIRYISRTKVAALFYPKSGDITLTASSDSSWGSATSSKGTTGNIFLVGGSPIAWWSKKQTVTAQSTCEAEYAALTSLAVAAQWIRPLYEEIFSISSSPIVTQVDNTAAMITANSNKVSARNRHFLMRESTVREAIRDGILELKYTPTNQCKADGLTKSLQRIKHTAFCAQINIDLKHSISGGV